MEAKLAHGPLTGIRVIDMTSVLMGPFASQALGDMGADVIKVEAPQGDLVREIGPARNDGMGPVFLNANRNKRSIVLDLKSKEGMQAMHRLLEGADVLMYNVRPQAMARLGLAYEDVAAVNPRIVYAGLFGFGQDGPYAARPAYDDLIQGAATLSSLIAQASGGIPRYVPTAIADRVVGITGVNGILASLLARERTGRGDKVDIPMFETMVGFVMGDHMGGLTYEPPLDRGGYARQLSPERRPYQTRDGHICALVYTDKQWRGFLREIGRETLMEEDARFSTYAQRSQNVDYVYGVLAGIFMERSTDDWMRLLERADVPFMPLHTLESVLEDPHLKATGFFRIVDHPTEGAIRSMRAPMVWKNNPPSEPRPAPRLGQHTREVLAELGYPPEQIDVMAAAGARAGARAGAG
ncbi:CaiB/BaiF CoA transferase family protein [Parapusillimonas granuli]|uniref:CoA transferase n=2 Tax=Parapusillimonas granuli TaxID=380911 RepID=A0A853G6R6_9BURK|nr:CoA transferase [Parapusillimonas granuli]MBB5216395.1 crotonobetainyl-CoA:carnitine CoA-transferase CaiB-like acyl-CoA transferase [Parapusillimonas granuli]NYT51462.1 CoA transferase [Parapusillimonas granuli]